jgi:hypothetical protein
MSQEAEGDGKYKEVLERVVEEVPRVCIQSDDWNYVRLHTTERLNRVEESPPGLFPDEEESAGTVSSRVGSNGGPQPGIRRERGRSDPECSRHEG